MKQPALVTTSSSVGDLLSLTPTIRKLFNTYGKKIVVISPLPSLLQNNPYILKNIDISTVDTAKLDEIYTVHRTFHYLGKRDPLGIEFKHAMCDIRQFHAKDLGFLLSPEELTCDFFADAREECMKGIYLQSEYVVVHPAQTWDSRTWEKEKWQELIDLLNDAGINVVAVGKDSGEYSEHISQDKPAWPLNIKNGIDLTNKTSLSQTWHILNESRCVITMDSGVLHLAGTTDSHIIQLGSSINPRFRAPYRFSSQEYKYSYVPGSCLIHCASDLSYSLRDWGNIQSVTLINTCLENKPVFECKPTVKKVFDEAIKILKGVDKSHKENVFPEIKKQEHKKIEFVEDKKWEQKINFTFNYGPKVEIDGDSNDPREFKVLFIDDLKNEIVYETSIKINHWCSASRKWFTKWRVEVWSEGSLVEKGIFDLNGKKALISLFSKAIGDTIAWGPYCLKFKELHGCELVVKTFYPEILKSIYPDMAEFTQMESYPIEEGIFYASYEIFYGVNKEEYNQEIRKINTNFAKEKRKAEFLFSGEIKVWNEFLNPRDPHQIPLAAIGSDILGLEYTEIRPHLPDLTNKTRPIEKKYVCISEFASAPGLKMWNNKIGWQKLVDYLKNQGFEVVSISLEKSQLKNIIKRNGKLDLSDRIWYLHHCEFFIGVSSGLSWLAWACGKKVVMISGATAVWNEFQEDNIRITNQDGCHGCWNSKEHGHKFGCFHWTLCPEDRNFECTRKISPGFVIDRIKEEGLIT